MCLCGPMHGAFGSRVVRCRHAPALPGPFPLNYPDLPLLDHVHPQDYYKAIQGGGGGIFFAVCRGKVSRPARQQPAGTLHSLTLLPLLHHMSRFRSSIQTSFERKLLLQVSEGLDFADGNARGVIIVGIPFPAAKDLKVGCCGIFVYLYAL